MNVYGELMRDVVEAGGEHYLIGATEYGYGIPLIRKGYGKPKVLFVGAVHAREHITERLLTALISRYNGRAAVDVVPMLNIDGVTLAKQGLNAFDLEDKKKSELLKINGGSQDFSLWKANINAVDLNCNFNAGFGEGAGNLTHAASASYIGDFPESEKETRAIANFIRNQDYALVIAYHSKGEEVYYGFREDNGYEKEAREFADYLGYELKETRGSAGGLKDWWTLSTKRLGLTVEVGEDRFAHPYPEARLPILIQKHEGIIELALELGERLWTKYQNL